MSELTDEERAAYQARWIAAAQGMQSGVAFEQSNFNDKSCEPKHLRVGVNSALVDHASLARLLISRGVITEREYMEALCAGMEAERDRYEQRARQHTGANVTFR